MKTQSSAYADFLFFRRSFSLILAAFLLTTSSSWAGSSCDQLFSSEKKTTENLLRPDVVFETDRTPVSLLQANGSRILLEWNNKSLQLHLRPIQDLEKTYAGSKIKLLNLLKQHTAFQLPPDVQADLQKIKASNFKRMVNEIEWMPFGPSKVIMTLDTDYFTYSFELDFRNYLLRNDENIVVQIDFTKNNYANSETFESDKPSESNLESDDKKQSSLQLPFKNAEFKFYDFPDQNRRLMIGYENSTNKAYLTVVPLDIASNQRVTLFPSQLLPLTGVHPVNSDMIGLHLYKDQVIMAFQNESDFQLRVADFQSKIPSSQIYHLSLNDKQRQVLFQNPEYDKEDPPHIIFGHGDSAISILTQDPFQSWGSIIYDIEQKKYFHSAWSIRQNRQELPLNIKVYPIKELGQDQFAVFIQSYFRQEQRYINRWIIMKP